MADKPPAFLPLPLPSFDTAPAAVTAPPPIAPPDPSLAEVGQDFEVTRARIREIEARALARLRAPGRSAALQAFAESDGAEDDEDADDE